MSADKLVYFLFGLVVGSFVNVVVYRLPRGQSILAGRSACPHCQRQIEWYDLIPVISFIILGGRCRHCRHRISWAYPLVELYSGSVFLATFWLFGPTLGWLFPVFLLEVFLILFLIDLRHLILPDSVILAGLVGTLIYGSLELAGLAPRSFVILSGANILTGLIFLVVLAWFWFVSRGRWLGLGDAKLMGLVGFVFGFLPATAIFYLAVLAGGAAGLALLLLKQATLKSKLPLGSFISLSATLYVLTGFSWLGGFHWESILLIFK